MIDRKTCLKRAKETIKHHYVLLVLFCAALAMWGRESNSMLSFTRSQLSKTVERGGEMISVNEGTMESVVDAFMGQEFTKGRDKSREFLQKQKERSVREGQNGVLGKAYSMLSSVIDAETSANILLKIVQTGYAIRNNIANDGTVFGILLILLSFVVYLLIRLFILEVLSVLVRRVFLEAHTYEKVPLSHAFAIYRNGRFVNTGLTMFLAGLLESLWTFTIIGGPVKHYTYFLAPYIAAENPQVTPRQALRLSRDMMKGNKWSFFLMDMSFLHWHLLNIITAGFSDIMYGKPLRVAYFTEVYAVVRRNAKEAGIPGAELLNDTCLYVKADPAALETAYRDIKVAKEYIEKHEVKLTGVRRFAAENFGLWIGSLEKKKAHQKVENRKQEIYTSRMAMEGRIYPTRLSREWKESMRHFINTTYMRCYTVWSLLAIFFVFAFGGWIWEISQRYITSGEFANRGMLYGPWIPIYGVGAFLALTLLGRLKKYPMALFWVAVVMCGILEFFTSVVMEHKYGSRWWDYSGYFLNLDGRICAEGLLVFGIGCVAVVYIAAPAIDDRLSRIKGRVIIPACLLVSAVFACDVIFSHVHPNTSDATELPPVEAEANDTAAQVSHPE